MHFSPTSEVISRVVSDETVLVDLDGEVYFSLNHSGSLVWSMLGDGRSVDDVVASTVATYEIPEQVARADVESLIEELVAAGLLSAG